MLVEQMEVVSGSSGSDAVSLDASTLGPSHHHQRRDGDSKARRFFKSRVHRR